MEDTDAAVPGVTTVDPNAVHRAATWERIRRRASIRGFLQAGREAPTDSGVQPSSMAALEPPSAALREEMERIREELEAADEREALELEVLKEATGDRVLAAESDRLADRHEEAQPRPEAAGS